MGSVETIEEAPPARELARLAMKKWEEIAALSPDERLEAAVAGVRLGGLQDGYCRAAVAYGILALVHEVEELRGAVLTAAGRIAGAGR